MLRSPNSPLDPHDVHLRHLLDQRATRAHLHDRVPSISELSDTPSLYSHAYLSPQPNSHLQDMSSNFASPNRDRLNDLAVSMLDMEDEPSSSNDYDQEDYDDGDRSTIEQDSKDDELGLSRMSLLGPKMRFHSKAPWELDNSAVKDEQESDDDGSIMSSSTRSRGGRARHFRFGGSKSVSTRRSSEDSSKSRRVANKSFDTTSGRGVIQTLAQASFSTTSLGAGASRQPYSSGHNSPSSFRLSPSSPRSPGFAEGRSSGSGDSESRPSFAYSVEDTHPYARSDHAAAPYLPSKGLAFPRSETASTVTESNTSHSNHPPPTIHEPIPQSPRLQAFGREISSPVSFRSAALPGESADLLPPRTTNLSGWTERSASSFNLISLEEARAQRTRSNTYQNPTISTNPKSSYPVASSFLPGDDQSEHTPSVRSSRARARSISAGARAKQALNNIVGNTPPKFERRGSEPAVVVTQISDGKTLRHKKSGFMRLFNGGRDEKSPPPPVPSLSEGYAAFNAQHQQQDTAIPKGIKIGRVPPPPVSPSMLQGPLVGDDMQSFPKQPSSPKHTPPPLNLVSSNLTPGGSLRPPYLGDSAQSAPAKVTEFPSLKLRPISTVFSAHFSDHILPSLTSDDEPDTPSSLQSPATVISPVTPGAYPRPEQISHSKTSNGASSVLGEEDQSAIIRALQDQIVTAKRAWQQQIWELEGQVRDLKAEVEDLRSKNDQSYCERCGRGFPDYCESPTSEEGEKKPFNVVNRPRARTGTGQSRFGSAV
ncbi:hypothetical protein GYMLUDRAFT_66068 [Collybiopsis luxurians FD-317 M1]|nr:hypothetical protein GYMLUDRAFT_66068 [Collybiopsis luxurians FD-317 M1]